MRVFGYFLHEQKVTQGPGLEALESCDQNGSHSEEKFL